MKYGTTKKKIAHIIVEGSGNGLGGYWSTFCGKWISPTGISEDVPGNARLCTQCQKKIEKAGSLSEKV